MFNKQDFTRLFKKPLLENKMFHFQCSLNSAIWNIEFLLNYSATKIVTSGVHDLFFKAAICDYHKIPHTSILRDLSVVFLYIQPSRLNYFIQWYFYISICTQEAQWLKTMKHVNLKRADKESHGLPPATSTSQEPSQEMAASADHL